MRARSVRELVFFADGAEAGGIGLTGCDRSVQISLKVGTPIDLRVRPAPAWPSVFVSRVTHLSMYVCDPPRPAL